MMTERTTIHFISVEGKQTSLTVSGLHATANDPLINSLRPPLNHSFAQVVKLARLTEADNCVEKFKVSFYMMRQMILLFNVGYYPDLNDK